MRTILFMIFIGIPSIIFSQKEKVNPKGKYFFGMETGIARSTGSANNFEDKSSFLIGLNAEYYFAKQWSILAEVKHHKTSLYYSYAQSSSSTGFWTFDLSGSGEPYRAVFFDGKVISVPLLVKWQFSIYRNFKMNFAIGPNFSFETKSNYIIPENPNADTSMFAKNYVGFSNRLGFLYFLDEKSAINLATELNGGGYKGAYNGLLGKHKYYNNTISWSIGYQKSF